MPLLSAFHAVRDYSRDQNNAYLANTDKFFWRMGDVITRTWDLGFTAFGGPPVHFQIEYRRFVQGTHGRIPWIDEQVVSRVVFLPASRGERLYGNSCSVSRIVRNLSSLTRSWQHQDVILYRSDTCRHTHRTTYVLDLEVSVSLSLSHFANLTLATQSTWSNRHVLSVFRSSSNQRSSPCYCVCFPFWLKCIDSGHCRACRRPGKAPLNTLLHLVSVL